MMSHHDVDRTPIDSNSLTMANSNEHNVCTCSSRTGPSTRLPSHHRCTPTSHRHRTNLSQTSSSQLLLLFLLVCCIPFTAASKSIYMNAELVEVQARTESLGSTFARLARSGTILVDPGTPPVPDHWDQATNNDDELRRRAEPSYSTNSISSSATKAPSSKSTLAPTPTSSGIPSAAPLAASPLPTPFDVGFSSNITTTCAAFMKSMLSNQTFKSCLPFSLVLQNSNSFFQTSKSLVRITQTLDTSCAANVTQCTTLLSSFAANITTSSGCATDLSTQNPSIQQALLGLQAYKPLYTASCLRNPSTSAYCFADAITNSSNPTDSYIYYLPLNISLVGGSQPTCDSCLRDTMGVFAAASSDRASALASTYVSAAMQVNVNCGPSFVNASLAQAVKSSAQMPGSPTGGALGVVMLFTVLISLLL